MLKLSDFDYTLPTELIAQHSLKHRDQARLLVVDRARSQITCDTFKNIRQYFKKNDLLVLNDTKVLHCRLIGKKITGGKVEILLTQRIDGQTFSCLVQPSRTKVGENIFFAQGKIKGVLVRRGQISFKQADADLIYSYGVVPLPPYIKREPLDEDTVYYQTVYAKHEGALASPTAGLHFTQELLEKIKNDTAGLAYLTLHVGLGTFRPVKCEDITLHQMEPEHFSIPEQTVKLIDQTKAASGRIIAVGTTALRALESYAGGRKTGSTNLFIYPGFQFKLTDCLLTNFHLPKTTLLMLVCAFGGRDLILQAYREAVEKHFRFYSYGDAMLII